MIDQRADVNAQSKVGATPLMGAVNKKARPQVELLLKYKAMVELLLKAGAKLGAKNSAGKTALDEATAAGLTDIAALLEAAGPKKRPGAK